MSRRKPLRARYSSGQPKPVPRAELVSPTALRRLTDAAIDGLKSPDFSNQAGRLYLTGKISATESSAAKRWFALTAAYAVACQAPQQPRSKSLDLGRGQHPADFDSEAGAREAKRHERDSKAYIEGKITLKNAGRLADQVVESVVIYDCAPAGLAELSALRDGSSALWTLWSSRKR